MYRKLINILIYLLKNLNTKNHVGNNKVAYRGMKVLITILSDFMAARKFLLYSIMYIRVWDEVHEAMNTIDIETNMELIIS